MSASEVITILENLAGENDRSAAKYFNDQSIPGYDQYFKMHRKISRALNAAVQLIQTRDELAEALEEIELINWCETNSVAMFFDGKFCFCAWGEEEREHWTEKHNKWQDAILEAKALHSAATVAGKDAK